jgi:esterase/lipase
MIYRSNYKNIIFEFTIPLKKQKGVILLLNGMPSVPKQNKLMESLSKSGYVAIFPRYAGTWESSGLFLAKSPVDDIRQLCSELNSKKLLIENYAHKKIKILTSNIIIIGTSFGGTVALHLADDPLVKKVIALSPVIDWKYYAGAKTHEINHQLKNFIREGFGQAYRFKDQGWERLAEGKLLAQIKNMPKKMSSKITIVFDKADTVTIPQPIMDYAENENISLKKINGLGHISFSKIPLKILLKLVS